MRTLMHGIYYEFLVGTLILSVLHQISHNSVCLLDFYWKSDDS